MMNSKIYMVTGTTSGIGKAVAHELAKTGETVVMLARDEERGVRVQQQISSATRNPNVDLHICDLGNLSSVRNIATVLKNRYEKIDVLINNASVYKRDRVLTVDGYETMFATNHLGPFLLTYLLMDRMLASGSARVINITAPATNRLNFDDLQGQKNFNSLNAFGATKMANLLFTFELARRMENTGVTVNALHPGLARSSLMKEAVLPLRLFTGLFSSPPGRAAKAIVDLAISPVFESTHGKFLHKGKAIEPPAYALEPVTQLRLWDTSEKLTDALEALEKGAEYNPTGSTEI
jgi:NAD(P)-dependent dehydrogenase (short-subunit alcohol dehydrogenase family)